ncbi:hypothetical protein SARC_18045 [Sphaeroforma arctica JP610]|uniref:Uncharacterized protein n=1 Tax=Sphaeroforma arctica JP610 TaxID=667725 RepID=A0A0L0EY71_9EUKA|nr:hypothetical protein SARC_18045 [Sphaeroforma arctica JP610]KNC69442.1 hypothetical protein SARC_18045 [Sphaeroforma arctica JP610]|eukprot:XP_014143344.1 hypothetical protein SARC_18045 [Sphaeroforma arctica JP610]
MAQATEAISLDKDSTSGHNVETYGGTMYFYPPGDQKAMDAQPSNQNRPAV